MDDPSDIPGEEHESLRHRGFQITVQIHYSDYDASQWFFVKFWPIRQMSYDIYVRRAASSECKLETGDHAAIYCCMINFRVSGEHVVYAGIGALLSILSAAISMLWLSTVIVDMLAVYIFREKVVFYPNKFTEMEMPRDLTTAKAKGD
jgi:hypothetical protein